VYHSIVGQAYLLCGRLALSQFNGAGDSASVKPAIGIDSERLTGESLEIAWLMYGLEQR